MIIDIISCCRVAVSWFSNDEYTCSVCSGRMLITDEDVFFSYYCILLYRIPYCMSYVVKRINP